MADVLTITQRSYNMSQIRSEETGPELLLKRLLILNGLGDFRMQSKEVPGRPDFYFPYRKSAVFVDGCFWHGCKKCYKAPQTNRHFWAEKIKTNMMRDQVVNLKLKTHGINVIRVREHVLKKSPEVVLDTIHKKLSSDQRPKVLDLFAGAGGLSEGFVRAGCEIVGHIEMDKKACDTLITRMVYHALLKRKELGEYKNYVLGKILRDDLIEKHGLQKERDSVICSEIGEDNYKKLIEEIKNRLQGQQLDIIVGGPPCQAYSHIGRARDEHKMKWDHRKFLYRYYVEFLKALKPKIFVFENVPGLISSGKGRYLKEMRRLMKVAGYQTDYRVINAADFGVPQNRKRIILVGWSKKSKLTAYPDFSPYEREYIVKDFFTDLPKIQAGKGHQLVKNFSSRNSLLKKLGILNPRFNVLMDHTSRPNTKQDLEIYRRAVLAKQKGIILKYNNLPERLKTHSNEQAFLDRFKVVDFQSKGSHTVVAHLRKDGHFYIHPDLKQNRSLTVREAARLQTFPDDYKFEGERGRQFSQIGNAVPPLLSETIARELIKHL